MPADQPGRVAVVTGANRGIGREVARQLAERGLDVVVGEANIRFRAPARFDDLVVIHMAFARLGRSSIRTAFRIERDDTLLVEGELRHVVVSAQTWRPV